MSIRELIKEWLEKRGCDGLLCEASMCECSIYDDDFMNCIPKEECRPTFAIIYEKEEQ